MYLIETVNRYGYVARTSLYIGVGEFARFTETCARHGLTWRILETSND